MLNLLFFIAIIHFSDHSSDFENARIVGLPRLTCSKHSINFFFDTNIPFQGRISVMKKMYIPECSRDYAINIGRNASFKLDIGRCTDSTYMRNGSRILTAYVEIGFHPLVITNSDRVYAVQCIDNSYAIVRTHKKSERFNCSHVVRLASKWEGHTVFHVGDSVVHEWSCTQEPGDVGRIQTFLTSCNAISQAGQIIHLIDENGCIVDSELMGDLVYNHYIPKIYARAKIFKLMDGERYRIECSLEMCRKDGACGNRPFPPKCAFTKQEILEKYRDKSAGNSTEEALMPGSTNLEFEARVKVSSEWMTVHYNEYTNVDQLHERYFLSSFMNVSREVEEEEPPRHFLMDISYRDPNRTIASSKEVMDSTPSKTFTEPRIIQPTLSPEIITEEVEFISELVTPVVASSTHSETVKTSSLSIPTPRPLTTSTQTSTEFIHSTTTTTPSSTTTERIELITPSLTTIPHRPAASPTRHLDRNILNITRGSKTSQGPSVATMKFYSKTGVLPSAPLRRFKSTTSSPTTTEIPFEDNQIFATDSTQTTISPTDSIENIVSGELETKEAEKFENPRDWRLDDSILNGTDSFSDRQISCGNATLITEKKACGWSVMEQLLLIWSAGSLFLWLIMGAVFLYRNSSSKSSWIAYRQRELQRVTQSRVLQQEHPWAHADAFEEPKIKNKHEIDMSKL